MESPITHGPPNLGSLNALLYSALMLRTFHNAVVSLSVVWRSGKHLATHHWRAVRNKEKGHNVQLSTRGGQLRLIPMCRLLVGFLRHV